MEFNRQLTASHNYVHKITCNICKHFNILHHFWYFFTPLPPVPGCIFSQFEPLQYLGLFDAKNKKFNKKRFKYKLLRATKKQLFLNTVLWIVKVHKIVRDNRNTKFVKISAETWFLHILHTDTHTFRRENSQICFKNSLFAFIFTISFS